MSYAKYKDLGADKLNETNEGFQDCVELTNSEEKNFIINDNKICVIDVYGTWCGPCKQIAPRYNKLASKYNSPGECMLVKENIDLKLSENLNPKILGVPTFMIYYKGNPVERIVGGDLNTLEQKINLLKSM
jgi:thioredoxin 1